MFSKDIKRFLAKLLIVCFIFTNYCSEPIFVSAAEKITAILEDVELQGSVPKSLYFSPYSMKYKFGSTENYIGFVQHDNRVTYLATSTDKQTWNIVANKTNVVFGDNCVLSAESYDSIFSDINMLYSADGATWKSISNFSVEGNYSDFSFINNKFNFVDNPYGSKKMFTSNDGLEWYFLNNDLPYGANPSYTTIMPLQNNYIAFDNSAENLSVYTAPTINENSTSWVMSTLPTGDYYMSIKGDGAWISTRDALYAVNAQYYRSDDGITWAQSSRSDFANAPSPQSDGTARTDVSIDFTNVEIGRFTHTTSVDAAGQQPVNFLWNGAYIKAPEMLDSGIKFVPYLYSIPSSGPGTVFSIESGALPNGMYIDQSSGEIHGVPEEAGNFEFTVFADGASQFYITYLLDILENTDTDGYTDEGLTIEEYVGEIDVATGQRLKTDFGDEVFLVRGDDANIDNFVDFWFNGDKLERGIDKDYIAEEGSTKITVRAQTFQKYGEGSHTIAAEFRNNQGEIKRAAESFTVAIPKAPAPAPSGNTGSGGGSSSRSRSSSGRGAVIAAKPQEDETEEAAEPPETETEIVFNDIDPGAWYYTDVMWASENKYIVGKGNGGFAPKENISDEMVTTIFARLANVDTSEFENTQQDGIIPGQWYSGSAAWAKSIGLLEEDEFSPQSPTSRGNLAKKLVKLLEHLDVEYQVTEQFIEFADADKMEPGENEAFQVLYKLGIFNGKGDNVMDPEGYTTRAELAALIHRVAQFVENNTVQ